MELENVNVVNLDEPEIWEAPAEDVVMEEAKQSIETAALETNPAEAEGTWFQRNRKKVLISAIAAILVVLAILAGMAVVIMNGKTSGDGLIHHITAAGVDLDGMTRDEAIAALQLATDNTYAKKDMVITLPDGEIVLSPDKTGASLDVEAVVDAALSAQVTGTENVTIALLNYMTLDVPYIRNTIDAKVNEVASELTQPKVEVTGTRPDLDTKEPDFDKVHETISITLGTPEVKLDGDALVDDVLIAYQRNDFTPIEAEYATVEPDAVDLEELYKTYCVEPEDAAINAETHEVDDAKLGYRFDKEAAAKLLEEAAYGDTIELPMKLVKPEVQTGDLEGVLFRDVLGAYDSPHTDIPSRTENLRLACEAINGTIIDPGEVFSFNGVVGERTPEKGYKAAAVYVGGKTASETGGGVCQVASTIYYCTLMADLEQVSRYAHQFFVTYVPGGMDATVYWGSLDYQWRNNTEYPIKIEASVSGGKVHIKLLGTDTKDYYVEMTNKTLETYPSGVSYENHKPGEGYYDGQELQNAYTGYKVVTYKNKYDKQTKQLISSEQEAVSVYSKRDRLVVRITGESNTTEPTSPTSATEAPTEKPTEAPTEAPTEKPTEAPTEAPTDPPSEGDGE